MVQFLANIFFNKEKNIVIKFSIINTVYITHTHTNKKKLIVNLTIVVNA